MFASITSLSLLGANIDIKEFVEKIHKNAFTYVTVDDTDLIGFIPFYAAYPS